MAIVSASLAEIPAIIDRLENSRFNYLDIQWGELRITLGGQPQAVPTAGSPEAPAAAAAAPAAPVAVAATPVQPPVAAAPAQAAPARGTPVKSPMVGRFYARPEPGAAPFVQVGDRVTADTTIGLIEVMKVFNAVTASVAGEVLSLAVQDGDFVEFDQPLAYVGT